MPVYINETNQDTQEVHFQTLLDAPARRDYGGHGGSQHLTSLKGWEIWPTTGDGAKTSRK